MRYDEFPPCCRNCKEFDWDYSEWHDQTFYFCTKNVIPPTKKLTCKKQRPYKVEQKNEGTECTEQHNRSNDRGGYAAIDQQ